MFKDFIARQRSVYCRPGIFFFTVMALWNLTCLFRSRDFFPSRRFLRANRLASENKSISSPTLNQFEILFVAAGSDIKMLNYSIPAAINSTRSSFKDPMITVIVPAIDIPKCLNITELGLNISIISEDDFVDSTSRSALKKKFGDRYGWALQQLLKIEFSVRSNAQGVLVVDSDTLLLSSRDWLDADGRQLLTPSDEFNSSYYKFLNEFGISSLKPTFTFVSHHMLLQPKYVQELMVASGWKDISNLIVELVKFEFKEMNSPFSIDYEAYAQYMMTNHPDKIYLRKWSNIAVHRDEKLDEQIPVLTGSYSKKFYSISLHSYL